MHLIDELSAMPGELGQAVKDFPRDVWNWKPISWEGSPGENFSAVGHVCHLRDIELDGYQQRISRVLSEDCPSLVSIDGYRLAEERRYDEDDLGSALSSFISARGETLSLLRGVRDSDMRRRTIFAEYGEISLGGLLHLLRSHDLQHLACLQWLLAMRTTRQTADLAPGAHTGSGKERWGK